MGNKDYWNEGTEAYVDAGGNGDALELCPYAEDTPEHKEWMGGWYEQAALDDEVDEELE